MLSRFICGENTVVRPTVRLTQSETASTGMARAHRRTQQRAAEAPARSAQEDRSPTPMPFWKEWARAANSQTGPPAAM